MPEQDLGAGEATEPPVAGSADASGLTQLSRNVDILVSQTWTFS